MSLDDLITLLLVVLFVGLPLAQRIFGRFTGQQRPGEGPPERPGRDRSEDVGERTAESGTSRRALETQQARGAGADAGRRGSEARDGASELERRLAEARRRVQEAREGSPAQAGRGGASRAGSQSSSRPLVAARPAPPTLLGREGGAAEAPPLVGFLGREGVREEPRRVTAPLQVAKRILEPRGSTLSQARGVVSLSRDDIFNGIVWHQILSEPVSARYTRRKSSRVR